MVIYVFTFCGKSTFNTFSYLIARSPCRSFNWRFSFTCRFVIKSWPFWYTSFCITLISCSKSLLFTISKYICSFEYYLYFFRNFYSDGYEENNCILLYNTYEFCLIRSFLSNFKWYTRFNIFNVYPRVYIKCTFYNYWFLIFEDEFPYFILLSRFV